MRKIQKICIGVFLGGVLLGGIGTGIALAEYSSISYGGEKKIGEEKLITENFDFEFDPEKGEMMLDGSYWSRKAVHTIVEDPEVPEGVIRYQVTYNPDVSTPFLRMEELQEPESDGATEPEAESDEAGESEQKPEPAKREQGILSLDAEYHGDGFAMWMEHKDELLAGLKRGEICSYRLLDMEDVQIHVNPETLPCVAAR